MRVLIPTLLLAALLPPALAAEAPGDDAVVAYRLELQATMVAGCSRAVIDPFVARALEKARAAGQDLSEAALRQKINSTPAAATVESTCRCALAEPIARLDRARTTAELDAVVRDVQANGGAALARDPDRIKACVPKPAASAAP